MSLIKLCISPTLIATLTCSILASFTAIANAQPTHTIQLAQKYPTIQRVQKTVTIQGNIVKGNPTIENIFCERINVSLTEFIPTEPKPGQFNVPTQRSVVQPIAATGNHLGEGCTYSLPLHYLPKIRPYGESTFKIRADSIDGIVGEQSLSYPFPNNIDIPLFPPPPPPR
ncbi:hypothetical protein VF14_26535 [Nostoc linckia z18]|jgi:hypothetical protein|uniref:Uncharacterized protein n=2 Tax=Nostoc linckia TaxID=92942 RepID=A0A9Q5Z823_NOSLI|nr:MULTISPECIES: hypothetical protein [Nostoc]PHK28626.1 hypothetical protein VF12_32465 [Nostoc linckia z15]PHK43512.1 hypothetical protein VF13_26670 [Nostoc linckia z16]MBC1239581.1 hypothetical protein [Nostoc sp. 2RC]PHJ58178.1 hypothetical protein VF05_34395 [Nostoc linckia z3]PHJ62895.1 hypothetical protein VF02_15930 [Nostoc linckia z1]